MKKLLPKIFVLIAALVAGQSIVGANALTDGTDWPLPTRVRSSDLRPNAPVFVPSSAAVEQRQPVQPVIFMPVTAAYNFFNEALPVSIRLASWKNVLDDKQQLRRFHGNRPYKNDAAIRKELMSIGNELFPRRALREICQHTAKTVVHELPQESLLSLRIALDDPTTELPEPLVSALTKARGFPTSLIEPLDPYYDIAQRIYVQQEVTIREEHLRKAEDNMPALIKGVMRATSGDSIRTRSAGSLESQRSVSDLSTASTELNKATLNKAIKNFR